MNNRLDGLFKPNKKILSIYFTAGYPRINDTATILRGLQKSNVDLVEIGMPFSDPLADGPTIQSSSTVALKNGMSTKILFEQLQNIRMDIHLPLIIMGYFNPILQYGVEKFCEECAQIGIDGLIIPDLPLQVYEQSYELYFEKYNLHNIFLITPQTSEGRIQKIDQKSKSFIYMVSSNSVTGSKNRVEDKVLSYFKRVKSQPITSPKLIGFGISNNQTYRTALKFADGVIIGSAFINFLDNNSIEDIGKFIKSIKE
ncbi:MAG: tryptophan synthase subunit alpha [Flavobacteriaceae bacterium]|nr:tryptophan synthase subunit alpha [Flavobacteriaceae bacterium]